jgi:predicted SAM-dependent methyltransferase
VIVRDRGERFRVRLGALALKMLKRVMPDPVRPTLRRAIEEADVALQHLDGVRRASRLVPTGPLRLNLGCGAKPRAGWVNVDLQPGADLRLDVRRHLPFADASCADIYAEHVLEHLAYPGEVERVLADWFRVLAPGGSLSLGVPDTEGALRAYVSGDDEYFAWCRTQHWHRDWIRTRLDSINYHFRQQSPTFGEAHLYAYDFETLAVRLAAAGFVDVRSRPFDPALDSEDRRIGTLYVRAVKA